MVNRLNKDQMDSLYALVFGSINGKIVLEDLQRKFGGRRRCFSVEQAIMAFSLGEQNVIFTIEDKIVNGSNHKEE